MHTFEITIQRQSEGVWPVVAEITQTGSFLTTRHEGQLALDMPALNSQSEARAYGEYLGQALFQGEIGRAFERARANIDDSLRLLLFIEADDDLRSLQWEWLCAPLDDGLWDFLSLEARILYSRYLPSQTDRHFPPLGRRDLRALIVVANPTGLDELGLTPVDVPTTVSRLRESLGDLPHDILADELPDAVGRPTLSELCHRISQERYTLLHIVAHSRHNARTGESVLLLTGESGEIELVQTADFIERLRRLRGARGLPHLTVLSAPDASSSPVGLHDAGQQLVRRLGMPAVLVLTTAPTVMGHFYQQLQAHGEPDRAVTQLTDYHLIPALYSRLGGRPLFSDALDRDLTNSEISYGLERLADLITERAPILQSEFDAQATILRPLLETDLTALSETVKVERAAALTAINELSDTVVDLSFNALALDHSPPEYDARAPFPGLRPFDDTEYRAFFFGREPLVQELSQRVSQNNFLAVLGPSGSGKSSLVWAGLIPALGQPYVRMVPSNDPLPRLAAALSQLNRTEPAVLLVDQFEELFTLCRDESMRQQFFEALLGLTSPTLEHRAESGKDDKSPSDESEITAQPDRASPTQHDGFSLVPNPPSPSGRRGAEGEVSPLTIIITMRADFWGECASYPDLKAMMQTHQELIGPMTTAELRRAMEQQARAVGLRFEADLSQTILDEVKDEPGAMPLLQHALRRLWERRHGRWLRAAEYRKLGGVKQAIAESADAIYGQLDSTNQTRMRELFLRLTRLDEQTADSDSRRDTRRRVSFDELLPVGEDEAAMQRLVQQLADARLVMTSVNSSDLTENAQSPSVERVEVGFDTLSQQAAVEPAETESDFDSSTTLTAGKLSQRKFRKQEVEVSHEALIRHWPRLRRWLSENDELLRLRQTISQDAQAWQADNRDERLLPRWNRKLEEAIALGGRLRLNQLEQAYLNACVALRDREVAEAEAQRQRELTQARRLTRTFAGATVIALILLALAGWSYWQSVAQAERSRSRELAAISSQLSSRQQYLPALLVALEASQIDDTFQALSAIQQAQRFLPRPLTPRMSHKGWMGGAQWSEDESRILTWSGDTVHIWDANNGEELVNLTHEYDVQGAQWNEDESQILTHSRNTVRIWDVDSGAELFRLTHEYNVQGARWNGDETRILTRGENTVSIWDSSGEKFLSLPHDDWVSDAQWNGAGSRILTRSENTVRIWDVDSGAELVSLTHEGEVGGVQWNEAGSRILTFYSRDIHIWNAENWEKLLSLSHEARVEGAQWNKDDSRILTWSYDNTVRIWDVDSGAELFRLTHEEYVNGAQWNGDESRILTWGVDNTARVWDSDSGEELLSLTHEGMLGAQWNKDETRIFTRSGNGVIIWNTDSSNQLLTLDHKDRVWDSQWNRDETRILTRSGNTAHVWNAYTGQLLHQLHHQGFMRGAQWNGDGYLILTWGEDNTAQIWNANTGEQLYQLHHQGAVRGAQWNGAETQILTWSEDNIAKIWNANTGEQLHQLHHQGAVRDAQWNDTETRILTWSEDNTVQIWNANTGEQILTLNSTFSYGPQWNGNASRIFTFSGYGIHIWNARSGNRLLALNHWSTLSYAQWNTDGSRILTINGHGTYIWNAYGSHPLLNILGLNSSNLSVMDEEYLLRVFHNASVSGAQWNDDESRILTWSYDNTARVWDADSGAELVRLIHEEYVNGAQWNEDESRILTWSDDNTARIWDTDRGAEILRLTHEDRVSGAQWNGAETRILTWSDDYTARIWEVIPADIISTACLHTPRNLTADEWRQYIGDEPYRRTCENLPAHPSVERDDRN